MGKPRRSRTATYVLIALALPTLALAKTWTFSWDSRPVEIQRDADGFAKISIDGGVELGDPGAPDLPWVHMSIDLDPGTVVTSWRFIPDAPRTIDQSLRPVPLQRALSSADTDRSPTEAAESAYAVDQPSSAAIFQGMRSSRGKMSAGFLFAPFRWEAASGRLDFVSGGTLEVETGPAPEGVFLPPPLREADLAPSEVAGRAPGAGRVLNAESGDLRVSALPSLEGMAVPSVIVTTEELKPAFQWLADWKTRDGRLTVIRTVEEIAAAYPQGVDEAEKIRLFLRDAYLYWGTKSVVMGGDPSIVPIRRARSYSWNAPEGLDITTDYYYACLDGNWNANGNALFGQAVRRYTNEIGDQTDFQPELVVGRISAKNAAEVAIYRQKYETYVQNPPAGSYYDDVLTMGEVLFDSNWRAGDCDECGAGCPSDTPCVNDDGAGDCFAMQQLLRDNPRVGGNWNFTELYERDYWWVTRGHPNAQPLNLSTVVSELNAGKNLVFHSGHGDRDRWAIGPDRMEARNLRALTNGPRYGGMVYSINCNSAAIAFDCAAEAWCFAPEGGGLLYVGSTNLDFPSAATVFQDRTFKLWPGNGDITPGQAFFAAADSIARANVPNDNENIYRFVLFSLIFLGDPDMNVWTTQPGTMVVSHAPQIELGAAATNVTVSLDGGPLADARVTIYKAGESMVTGKTDATGLVSLPFVPTTTGACQVTVTHPEARPYMGAATVVSPTSASFLTVSEFSVDDVTDGGAGIVGNGNGRIEVGETVGIRLSLLNRGGSAATGASASLEVADDAGLAVTVLQGQDDLGTVPAGGSASASFLVSVEEGASSDATRLQETLNLEVTLGPAGQTHTETLTPNAYRPAFTLFSSTAVEVADAGGAPDGIPEGGDTWKVAFEFLSTGEGTASGLQVRLAPAPGNGISISPETLLLPDAERFQLAASDTFEVIFFANNQTRMEVSLEDTRTDPPTEMWKRVYDLSPPSAPTGLRARGFQSSIALTWERPADPDLAGYRLYRSAAEDGPYEQIGLGYLPVESAVADTAYYSDEGLPPLTRYFYRVTSVDLSGHESLPSDSFLMSTSPGTLAGWPVSLDLPNGNAPTIEELNGFGTFEVLAASDAIYAFGADGSDYYDGDLNPSTPGKLTSPDIAFDFRGKPAVADVDGDGEVDVIGVPNYRHISDNNRNADLTAFDRFGVQKWRVPMTTSIVLSSPAIGDLDDTPGTLPDVVVLANRAVYAVKGNGDPYGPAAKLVELSTNDAYFLYGSVGLADVAGGPGDEIIFTTRAQDAQANTKLFVLRGDGTNVAGFPYQYAQAGSSQDGSNSSPAIADLDNDGKGEIVIATRDRVWMFDPGNSAAPMRWNRDVGRYDSIELNSSPAIGDVNRDGQLEVVIGGANGRLYVLDALTGIPLPEFNEGSGYLQIGQSTSRMGSPILGDLTGDNRPEILIGDNQGNVYCYQWDGTQLSGFPYVMGGVVSSGLAMWDIDKDHHVNVVIQANQVQNIVVLDFPQSPYFDHSNPDLDAYPWTQFRHDSHNSGWLPQPPVLPLALQAPELTAVAGLDVELRWVGQPGFAHFQLYRRLENVESFDLVGEWRPDEVAVDGSENDFRAVDQVPGPGTYVYRLIGIEPDGAEVTTIDRFITVSTEALEFALHSPQPNPFGTASAIRLDLPKSTKVALRVLDPTGRRVRTLMQGDASAGSYTRVWDGRDDQGREVGAGVYFIAVSASGLGERSVKLIHLR